MRMHIVAVASQKGGSGKTTIAGHIAVDAEISGDGPVALIDTDPQGSLAAWWNARKSETPIFARVDINDLERHLGILRSAGIKLVVIDTPPAISASISAVIKVSHLIVIPSRPSPHDLRAVGATVDLVEAAGKPMLFIVNAATAKTRIAADAAVALSQHGTVAPVTLHQRTDFASSMIDGRTVGEIDSQSKSAKEVAGLWQYVHTRLRKHEKSQIRSTAEP
jgi:chromosome partitioning protein